MRYRSAAPNESRPLTNMDRKAWIVVIFCIAALGLWQWAYMKYYAPTPEQLAEARRAAEEKQAAASPSPTPAPAVAEASPAPAP